MNLGVRQGVGYWIASQGYKPRLGEGFRKRIGYWLITDEKTQMVPQPQPMVPQPQPMVQVE